MLVIGSASSGKAGARAANEASPELARLPDPPAKAPAPVAGAEPRATPPAADLAAKAAPERASRKRGRSRFAVARSAPKPPVAADKKPLDTTVVAKSPDTGATPELAAKDATGPAMRPIGDGGPIETASQGPGTHTAVASGPREAASPTLTDLVARHARENGVPVELAQAVVRIESRGNARAANHGALGLMQIKPGTARSVGFNGGAAGLFSPEVNLHFGMKVLGAAYRAAGGDTCRALAQYQSGARVTRMSAANRAYCSRARAVMAGA